MTISAEYMFNMHGTHRSSSTSDKSNSIRNNVLPPSVRALQQLFTSIIANRVHQLIITDHSTSSTSSIHHHHEPPHIVHFNWHATALHLNGVLDGRAALSICIEGAPGRVTLNQSPRLSVSINCIQLYHGCEESPAV